MASIKGISVEVTVGSIPVAPSKDPLYLGVYGKNGGREFALDVLNYQEWNTPGKVVKLKLGEGCCSGDIQVRESTGGGCNTPALEELSLYDVEYVYIRKLSRLLEGNSSSILIDDALQLSKIVVDLCNDGDIRRFKKEGQIFLSHQCGLQHWLRESQKPGCMIRIDLRSVRYSGDNIGNDIEYKFSALFQGVQQVTVHAQEHTFPHGFSEYHATATTLYFMPGCCGVQGQLKLLAEVVEHDTQRLLPFRQDDRGHEDEEYQISCGKYSQQNFTVTVRVQDLSKVGVFTFEGSISSECTG